MSVRLQHHLPENTSMSCFISALFTLKRNYKQRVALKLKKELDENGEELVKETAFPWQEMIEIGLQEKEEDMPQFSKEEKELLKKILNPW